jgi:hypothetical protein
MIDKPGYKNISTRSFGQSISNAELSSNLSPSTTKWLILIALLLILMEVAVVKFWK